MLPVKINPQHKIIQNPPKSSWCFIFNNQSLLLYKKANKRLVPTFKDLITQQLIEPDFGDCYCFAEFNGIYCLAFSYDARIKTNPNFEYQAVKQSHQFLQPDFFKLTCLGCHLTHWFHTHRFCGKCGHKMCNKAGERARQCAACRHVVFPRLSPSIIVLVTKGEQMLLARSPHFPDGIYSTLAGFVEPGESVEEAVEREVLEEVGITLKNLNYFGSQPWPFPESLMLGFTAEYASGELAIDHQEIEAAAWFDVNHLPKLPTKISIARQLIDQHCQAYLDSPVKAH